DEAARGRHRRGLTHLRFSHLAGDWNPDVKLPLDLERIAGSRARQHRVRANGGIMATASEERDPRYHTQKMRTALREIREHLREDIEKVDEPQLKAMFETSAEVIGGLEKAFSDYEQKNEPAWQT